MITEIYNSLQLRLLCIGYYNLYYIKTDNYFYGERKKKHKEKWNRKMSPQDDFNDKHKKVACLLVLPPPLPICPFLTCTCLFSCIDEIIFLRALFESSPF